MFEPLSEWARRVWYLLNRRRFEDALRNEMDAHRARLSEPNRFGDIVRLREDSQDAWGWRWLDDLVRDLRLSVRTLGRSPAFTATALLILSLGTGLNLALFQLLNAALLRPLHVANPETLVKFDRRGPNYISSAVSYPLAHFVADHNTVLSAVMLRRRTDVIWGESGERISAVFVSENWLNELGASMTMGRSFDTRSAAPDTPPVAVVSHLFWERQLSGRADVVGSTLRINERPATIVGVTAADFSDVDLGAPAIWIPLSQLDYFVPGSRVITDWSDAVDMFARLAPGVSIEAATDRLRTVMNSLRLEQPDHVPAGEYLEPRSGSGRFLSPRESDQVRVVAFAVSTLALLVLLIACLNLSNLTLSRATGRMREMGIRVSLGAGRWRIVRHLVAESLALAILGGIGGFGLAQLVLRALPAGGALAAIGVTPDWRMFIVMAVVIGAVTAVVGLVPAWRVGRIDLTTAVRDGGERASLGLHGARLRYALVAGQIAGSCLLLVVTFQLAHSLQRLVSNDLGFEFSRVVVFEPSLHDHGLDAASARSYWDQLRQTLQGQPESAGTSLVSESPLSSGGSASRYRDTAPSLRINNLIVEPSFFRVMQIPLLAGRVFEPSDDPRTAVIISRRVALVMYGSVDVVGRYFPRNTTNRVIVGIAGDAHVMNVRAADAAEQYWPLGDDASNVSLLVRARTDPGRLVTPLRQAARAVNPSILPAVRLLRDDFDDALRAPRLAGSIGTAIALVALGLAAIGVFGVVTHGARLRTKEIGVRLALGARRSSVVGLLLRSTIWSSVAGLLLGLAGGLALTTVLAGAPFYLQPRDLLPYVAAGIVFSIVGTIAALIPAWRTLRANPLRALRQD